MVFPEGVILTSGKHREELGHLEGRRNKLDVSANYSDSPTYNHNRLEWVIEAAPGIKIIVKVLCERAGSISREVILE